MQEVDSHHKEVPEVIKQNSRKKEHGQALVLIALALVGLAGIAGLVIDGGNVFLDRRNAQNAADTAALTAALARVRGDENMVTVALGAAGENGYDNNGTTNTVEVHSPPISGPNQGKIEYIQIIIVSHVKTYIASVVGWSEITNRVEAVARTKIPEVTEILHGYAIVSLSPSSDCGSNKAFWVHGATTLDITGGGVFINSNNDQCALIQQGDGGIQIHDNSQINVVGAAQIQKPRLLIPGVTVGVVPISYPPPFFMPKVECEDIGAQISEDGTSMSAGKWDEEFPPAGVTQLDSGVYCLGKGINITSNLTGHDVVLRVDSGEVHFGGNASIQLDAPSSGDNAGLLLYLPIKNSDKVVLNGGANSLIQGTILAPASAIEIKGNSSSSGFHSQIIGYTIDADASGTVVIVYNDVQNFNAVTMPEVQLSE
jgi:hypothetical protein